MKLSNIKTREDFNAVANNQYGRTKRLFNAANDASKPTDYRIKATGVWIEAQKHVRETVLTYLKGGK